MCYAGDPNLTGAAQNIRIRNQNVGRADLGLKALPLIDLRNLGSAGQGSSSAEAPVQSRSTPRKPKLGRNSLQVEIGGQQGTSQAGGLNIPQ